MTDTQWYDSDPIDIALALPGDCLFLVLSAEPAYIEFDATIPGDFGRFLSAYYGTTHGTLEIMCGGLIFKVALNCQQWQPIINGEFPNNLADWIHENENENKALEIEKG